MYPVEYAFPIEYVYIQSCKCIQLIYVPSWRSVVRWSFNDIMCVVRLLMCFYCGAPRCMIMTNVCLRWWLVHCELIVMYILERCKKSMFNVKSCSSSDDDRVRIIPSLLRWSVEECNFGRYPYFIIVVLHLEEIHIVFYHLKNPKRVNEPLL